MTLAPEGQLLAFAREHVFDALAAARVRAWLSSPFLSRNIASALKSVVDSDPRLQLRFLTALNSRSVQAGALSPHGLQALSDSGFELRTAFNLHAKIVLTDESWGLVGSGNLTRAGLGPQRGSREQQSGNLELGVVLNKAQRAETVRLFEAWWANATPVDDTLLSYYKRLPRWPADRRREPQSAQKELATPGASRLAEALAALPEPRQHWMKAAYYRPGQDEDGWWHRGWISDRLPAPYSVDDLIVLYLGGDGSPQRCPALLRVTSPPREDPRFLTAHGAEADIRRWPFVTRTQVVFDLPIDVAPRPESFGIDPRSTQPGYRRLSRPVFERACDVMTAAAHAD